MGKTTAKPSPGAVRAAEALTRYDEKPYGVRGVTEAEWLKNRREHFAAIIDREAVAPLADALRDADRIESLHADLGESYARINGAGRTTAAESTTLARKRVEEIKAELRRMRDTRRALLASLGKGGA